MSTITEATFNTISHLIITSTDVVYIGEKSGSESLKYMPGIPEQLNPKMECLIQSYLILKMIENSVLFPEFHKNLRSRPHLDFTNEKTVAEKH